MLINKNYTAIMEQHNYIPEAYDRIKVVSDPYAFLATDFAPKANVVLYPRNIEGDFDALATKMAEYFELKNEEIFIKYSEAEKIRDFQKTLNETESHLIDKIIDDMEFLYSSRVKTHMRILTHYTEDPRTHNFHVDGACQDFDRYMTCYNNPVTQFVKNEDVMLVRGHDAHVKSDAKIYEFQPGDLWKARVRNKPKSKVRTAIDQFLRIKENRAFVHRAQFSKTPRLMVVGDQSL